MWMHVYPSWKMNFNSKNDRKRNFCIETKASITFIPMKRMCLLHLIMKGRRLLCEFMFVQIDIRILILEKVERDVFLMKPKPEYHLSQWGECVNDA